MEPNACPFNNWIWSVLVPHCEAIIASQEKRGGHAPGWKNVVHKRCGIEHVTSRQWVGDGGSGLAHLPRDYQLGKLATGLDLTATQVDGMWAAWAAASRARVTAGAYARCEIGMRKWR